MTPEEKNEFKELLQMYITSFDEKIESKFDIIDFKLDSIQAQTTKTNGRVTKTEQDIIEALKDRDVNRQFQKDENDKLRQEIVNHVYKCPNTDKLKNIETDNITKKEIKKWLIAAIGITGVVVTIIVNIMKFI